MLLLILFLYLGHTVDCMDPSCSAHGVCIHGECHCQPGWGGSSCEIVKAMCPDQCSGHGTYNAETTSCACDQNWTGADCALGMWPMFVCGPHWSGPVKDHTTPLS